MIELGLVRISHVVWGQDQESSIVSMSFIQKVMCCFPEVCWVQYVILY